MYDLPESLQTESVRALEPGSSVLVTGPPMSGKRDLALDIIAAGHDDADGLMLISTQKRAARIIRDLERRVGSLDTDRIGIVDCAGGDDRRAIRNISTEHVSTPGDLTGISIGTVKLMRQFRKHGVEDVCHGLVSVSTMLQYMNFPTVFKFLHIYTRRIADSDGLGVFTLDNASHDPQTVNTITGEFDGLVELRTPDDGGREVRLRGFGGSNTGWQPL